MLRFILIVCGSRCLKFGTSGTLDNSSLFRKYGRTLSMIYYIRVIRLKLLPSCASLLTLPIATLNMSFPIVALHAMFLIRMKTTELSLYPGSHFVNLCLSLSDVRAQMISLKMSMLHHMFSRIFILNPFSIPTVPLCMAQLLARTLSKRVQHRGCSRVTCIFWKNLMACLKKIHCFSFLVFMKLTSKCITITSM
jgi:hypothetical protein